MGEGDDAAVNPHADPRLAAILAADEAWRDVMRAWLEPGVDRGFRDSKLAGTIGRARLKLDELAAANKAVRGL